MNVQEELLNRKVDPALTDENLTDLCAPALPDGVRANGYRVLTGGCWNRVIGVALDAPAGAGRDRDAACGDSAAPGGCSASLGDRRGDTLMSAPDEIVVKISPRENDAGIIREHDVLRVFADKTQMPVPQPLLVDPSGTIVPGTALVMTMIPGEVMHRCFGMLGRRDRERIGDQIADYVSELHAITDTGFGGVELAAEDRCRRWADFWLPRFDKAYAEISAGDYISEAMLEEVKEARASFEPALDIGEGSTLTHYDIWSGNVMIDIDGSGGAVAAGGASGELGGGPSGVASGGARVSGFIDVPGFYADYARELSFMMMFGVADRAFFQRYLRDHGLDDGFELRVNIYNLKMHLKHIMMYPHERYYRQGAMECLRFIQEHV